MLSEVLNSNSGIVQSRLGFRMHILKPPGATKLPKYVVGGFLLSLFPHTCFLEPPGATMLLKTVFKGLQFELDSLVRFSGFLMLPGFPKQYSQATGLSRLPHASFPASWCFQASHSCLRRPPGCPGFLTCVCFGFLALPCCPQQFAKATRHRFAFSLAG